MSQTASLAAPSRMMTACIPLTVRLAKMVNFPAIANSSVISPATSYCTGIERNHADVGAHFIDNHDVFNPQVCDTFSKCLRSGLITFSGTERFLERKAQPSDDPAQRSLRRPPICSRRCQSAACWAKAKSA